MEPAQRGTILLDDAKILTLEDLGSDQFALRLAAPGIAAIAEPGAFVHLRCDPLLAMRRPMSLMRADVDEGWIEVLFKRVGEGTRLLATRAPGEQLSVLGPIGNGFTYHPQRPRILLIGGGVGIPPMVFIADRLRHDRRFRPLVLMGSEIPFPFRPRPSQWLVPGIPDGVIGCMPLLEDWGVASRLASLRGFAGCFDGWVTDLAHQWLATLDGDQLAEVAICACGPTPMLRACARLATEFSVPCQVSLEESMACAVGGCAGCAVRVRKGDREAMRRVCVDGPVFSATSVVWN